MVSPLFYLMAAAMVLMALASYRYNKILFLVEGTAAVLSGLAVLVSDVLYRRNISTTVRSAKRVLTGEEEAAFQAFALPVAVVAPAGDIVWANEAFAGSLCGGRNFLGDNVLKYIYPKTFRQVMGERGTSVSHNGREYTVYGARAKEGYILYFVDDTYFKTISKEYRERRPVVCLAAFDNREELVRDSFGGDDSRIVGEVDAVMRRWVIEEMNGFVRRLDSSRYLFVVDDAHIEQAKQKRFHVLDEVRTIKSARNNMSATMSIGVGRVAKDIAESELWARQALDMALGRGGDQVAVKQEGDSYEFFGGLSKGVEKRDKVRTRVIAATLSDHVKASDQVFVMGHKNSDLDSVGSAVGMWAAIHKGLEKPVHIVLNRNQTLAGPLVEMTDQAYPNDQLFISPLEALQSATERSLLIVVDTHSVNFVESRELLERVPRVVVIDHHRMMVTHIKNALIFYHEPYASSASEMVTELAQYIKASAIDGADAQALLAGIMLDTKNFVSKAGVRTFEAAAYLRRLGAETSDVRKYFNTSLSDYQQRIKLMASAELYHGCAVASTNQMIEDINVVAAQAADELLNINGVAASFVMYETGRGVNFSARSMGEMNVQIIMESLGGGGHLTMAGAQLSDCTLESARQRLFEAIDDYLSKNPRPAK